MEVHADNPQEDRDKAFTELQTVNIGEMNRTMPRYGRRKAAERKWRISKPFDTEQFDTAS